MEEVKEVDFSQDIVSTTPNEKPRKGKRKEREDEDILDRFTDPAKKRKKKEKKELSEKEKRDKLMSAGKLKAEDCFNVSFTPEEITLYKTGQLETLPTVEYLKSCTLKNNVNDIGYKRMLRLDGIYCVLDFITAASHCTEWLDTEVRKMGWRMNMTGYNPISVSHSTEELLSATMECYKMAAKQMLLLMGIVPNPPTKESVSNTEKVKKSASKKMIEKLDVKEKNKE
jgi:hypothetical protein